MILNWFFQDPTLFLFSPFPPSKPNDKGLTATLSSKGDSWTFDFAASSMRTATSALVLDFPIKRREDLIGRKMAS